MRRDFEFFQRRYEQIEDDLLEILDFIDIKEDFDQHCYKVGASKLMDFCLKVGTEVETLFREILKSKRFDPVTDISKKREKQNMNVYRELIEPEYGLSDYKLTIRPINKEIHPFEDFKRGNNPEWFRIYSKYKHDKIELIEQWNLKHSLFSLGCLLILVINHPSLDGKEFRMRKVSQKVFDLLSSTPRFSRVNISVKF